MTSWHHYFFGTVHLSVCLMYVGGVVGHQVVKRSICGKPDNHWANVKSKRLEGLDEHWATGAECDGSHKREHI